MQERTDHTATGPDTHPPSTVGLALEALHMHTLGCEQCRIDYRDCPTGRALVRTIRDARREARQ